MSDKQFKMHYFAVDQCLARLIQQSTKHPTADILHYFYDLAMQIAQHASEKQPLKRVNKTLLWHYEGTEIPYQLTVYGSLATDGNLWVHVRFPVRQQGINVTSMIDSIVETGLQLDGSQQLPEFKKPPTRIPVGFKKFLHQ